MSWSGKASGFSVVTRQLTGIGDVADPDALRAALLAGGEPIAEAARPLVRVRTGRLRDSIAVGTQLSPRPASLDHNTAAAEAFVGPGPFPEATTEEFGTAHEAPHPFMRPAFESQQDAAFAAIAGALGATFDQSAGG